MERTRIHRSIRQDEVAVIRAALEKAPSSGRMADFDFGIEDLEVVAQCDCGCDSVDFASPSPTTPATQLADGAGTTKLGGTVGIIVWGREGRITGLEVYDLGAGEDDLTLPEPESIRPFDAGADV